MLRVVAVWKFVLGAAGLVFVEVADKAKDRIRHDVEPQSSRARLRRVPYALPYLHTPVLQTMSQSSVSGLGPNLESSDSAIYEYAVGQLLIERRPLLRGLKVFLMVNRGIGDFAKSPYRLLTALWFLIGTLPVGRCAE